MTNPARMVFSAEGRPVHYVAAALQERDQQEQSRMLHDAGERIARAGLDAFQEVVQAFLRPVKREQRDKDRREDDDGKVAEAPSPSNGNPVGMKADTPQPPHCHEVVAAIMALGFAVRMNANLVMAARSAATKARTLAPNGSAEADVLDLAANGLEEAAQAAGTMPLEESNAEREDNALADQVSGGEPTVRAEAMSALREWRDLTGTGHTSMDRERYVRLRLGLE